MCGRAQHDNHEITTGYNFTKKNRLKLKTMLSPLQHCIYVFARDMRAYDSVDLFTD